jgi:hypothetical protein
LRRYAGHHHAVASRRGCQRDHPASRPQAIQPRLEVRWVRVSVAGADDSRRMLFGAYYQALKCLRIHGLSVSTGRSPSHKGASPRRARRRMPPSCRSPIGKHAAGIVHSPAKQCCTLPSTRARRRGSCSLPASPLEHWLGRSRRDVGVHALPGTKDRRQEGASGRAAPIYPRRSSPQARLDPPASDRPASGADKLERAITGPGLAGRTRQARGWSQQKPASRAGSGAVPVGVYDHSGAAYSSSPRSGHRREGLTSLSRP